MVMTNIAMENGPFIDGLLYMIWLMFTLKMVFYHLQMVFTFESGILPSINGPL
jgi:hypothetical protein